MQTLNTTTPFGRRPMTLGLMSRQIVTRDANPDAKVSKWDVFKDIRDAKEALGVTDRALAILYALLTFRRDEELAASDNLIFYPSNDSLIRRANGMSPATLRRQIAILVECGLLFRRDSPNGKRFARKGEGGTIEQAYGFDLSPIVARADEFRQLAEAVKAERKAFRAMKERLTIRRRDVVKMIEAGISEDVPGNWSRFRKRYEAIMAQLPRRVPHQVLKGLVDQLEDLWADVHETLELFINSEKMSANESHSDRHIQDSNSDINPHGEQQQTPKKKEEPGTAARPDNLHTLPKRDLPLGMVLSACPEILNHARSRQVRTWGDLVTAAEDARPYLGISPSAWQAAVEVMGAQGAAITVAAILQRSDQIKSGGGYLRSLTERARDGKFSTWPMITALLNAKMAALKSAAVGKGPSGVNQPQTGGSEKRNQPSSTITSALEKSMKARGWE